MKSLCENCLTVSDHVQAYPIGNDKGSSQYDSWREQLALCPPCREALDGHDLEIFHSRFKARELRVDKS